MKWGSKLMLSAMALALSPMASADAASVTPASQDYGSQNVGAASAPASFTLTTSANICVLPDMTFGCLSSTFFSTDTTALGGGPGTTTSGDFTTHNTDCNYPSEVPPPAFTIIGPPAICHFEVSFAPTAAGARSRTMTFPDTGGPAGTLDLAGAGVVQQPSTPSVTAPTLNRKKKCKKKHRSAATAKKCKKKR